MLGAGGGLRDVHAPAAGASIALFLVLAAGKTGPDTCSMQSSIVKHGLPSVTV